MVAMQSNPSVHRKSDIVLWSVRSCWAERFKVVRRAISEENHFHTNMKIDPEMTFPKIEIMSNELSQIEATPLLTSPACSIQFILRFLLHNWKTLEFNEKRKILFSLRCCSINTVHRMCPSCASQKWPAHSPNSL